MEINKISDNIYEITQEGEMGFDVKGEEQSMDYESIKDRVMNELKQQFNPEFINRLDETIVFRSLSRENLRDIVDLMLEEVEGRLEDNELTLDVSQSAKDYLIEKGYDPEYGARPLRRTIQRRLEDPLAEEILNDRFTPGSIVKVRYRDGSLKFSADETDEALESNTASDDTPSDEENQEPATTSSE